MLNYLAVAIGGACGMLIRFFVTNQVDPRLGAKWPIATHLVNLIGCFLIGWFAVHFEKTDGPKWLQVALIGGICGGMTTFSAFIFELLDFLQTGLNVRLIMYLTSSVLLGLIAVYLGMRIASA
ncbi:MAG: CrcB family protein [Candidatus Omnitrophica bacterium]|nr:CrcB family protein [Candidatus Omnitrophota bacterium]